MRKQPKSVAETAAYLAGNETIKGQVEHEIQRSRMVTTLLQLRIQKGKTQKQVADYMGCDPSKISKLEAGNDLQLKWMDILGYLSALGVSINILFEDHSLPAAGRIKQHVFAIHNLLEKLAGLAQQVCDDTKIVDKIHQFYGEVLFNFLGTFGDSYKKLLPFVKFDESELSESSSLPKVSKKQVKAKSTSEVNFAHRA
jgi:transcriptional regulator with XRE-family HTH domain